MKRFFKMKWGISLLLLAAAIGGYFAYGQTAETSETRYVLGTAAKGTLVVSVAGSGQVSAENQVDVSPKVSGEILQSFIKLGEEVTTGTPLFEIERKDAAKTVRSAEQSVRDAQISLESAQISYEKLMKPESSSSVLQAQNAVNQAERALADLQDGPDSVELLNAESKVRTAEQNTKLASDGTTPKVVRDVYDKNVISLKNMLVTLKDALGDTDDVLGVDGSAANFNFSTLFSVLDQSKKISALTAYDRAKASIDAADDAVQPLQLRDEPTKNIDAAAALVKTAVDDTAELLDDMRQGFDASLTSASFSQSSLDQLKSTNQSDITAVTNAYSTLNTNEDSVTDAYETFTNAQDSLTQANAELAKLQAGPDPDDIAQAKENLAERQQALKDAQAGVEDIDIKVALNTIAQRKSSLQNAQDTLTEALDGYNDYTVRSPIDGVIAQIDAKTGTQASPSAAMATVLTKSKIAEISLNEVDIAKIKVGQKATLTFDAVPDLTIAAEVVEVAMIGTTNQGVVTYTVKIAFLTDDDRIKTGMGVSATIATEVRTDALLVPNAAVHQAGGGATVDVLDGVSADGAAAVAGVTSKTPPTAKNITTGLSNDQFTEVTGGLKEGDAIVVRTIVPTTGSAAVSTGSTGNRTGGTFQNAAFSGAGGATIRIQR